MWISHLETKAKTETVHRFLDYYLLYYEIALLATFGWARLTLRLTRKGPPFLSGLQRPERSTLARIFEGPSQAF